MWFESYSIAAWISQRTLCPVQALNQDKDWPDDHVLPQLRSDQKPVWDLALGKGYLPYKGLWSLWRAWGQGCFWLKKISWLCQWAHLISYTARTAEAAGSKVVKPQILLFISAWNFPCFLLLGVLALTTRLFPSWTHTDMTASFQRGQFHLPVCFFLIADTSIKRPWATHKLIHGKKNCSDVIWLKLTCLPPPTSCAEEMNTQNWFLGSQVTTLMIFWGLSFLTFLSAA